MVSAITQGVKVSVFTHYQPDFSSPAQMHYVFTYHIKIENQGEHTIQLLRRYWQIYDSTGMIRSVEGEGVVGIQPILEPGDSHEYVSGCNLKSTIGKMEGYYFMERIKDGKNFTVEIPTFNLIVPYVLN